MAVKVSLCPPRQILEPCGLEGLASQVDPYIGCEHHCYYCYALNQAETDWAEGSGNTGASFPSDDGAVQADRFLV